VECHKPPEDGCGSEKSERKKGVQVVGGISKVKDVDVFLENMGLIVCDRDGKPVLLSEYMEEFEDCLNEIDNRISAKGNRELKKLEWAMNDGTISAGLERNARVGRGKILLLYEDFVLKREGTG